MQLISEGRSIELIAVRVNHSKPAIIHRCNELGLKPPIQENWVTTDGAIKGPRKITAEDLARLPPLGINAGFVARRQAHVAFLIALKRAHRYGTGERVLDENGSVSVRSDL